jgi:hypothetical protein
MHSNIALGVGVRDGGENTQHQSPRLRSSTTHAGRLAPVRTRELGPMNEVDRLRTTLDNINIKDQQTPTPSGMTVYRIVFFIQTCDIVIKLPEESDGRYYSISMSLQIDELSDCIPSSYYTAYFTQSHPSGPGMSPSDVLEEIDLRPYSRPSDMNVLAVKRPQAAWSGTGTALQAPVYPGQKSSGTGGTYV